MYYEVIPLKLFRQDAGVLTYAFSGELKRGQVVTIPLGKLHTAGVVERRVGKPQIKTREITSVLYEQPVPEHLLCAAHWLSEYYLTPLPTAAGMILPKGVTKTRRKVLVPADEALKLPIIPLNPAQKIALEGILRAKTPTKLLHGVTGSGKTNIYLKLAAECLKTQKSAILLVPEIALTSQLVQVFSETFGGKVVVMHSGLTEAERHRIWEDLLNSDAPQVIIGARSALFAPVRNLGLIMIDEAHEGAYYQENAPRYSALRLASFMAKTLSIPCVLGTATPLVSDYYLAEQNGAVVRLAEKAKQGAGAAEVKVVDFKDRAMFSKNRYFSNALLSAIKRNLEKKQQTLIFHNRRGSAPLTICENCGWQALCPNCFLPLTLHTDDYQLVCHTCGHTEKVPLKCAGCGGLQIMHKGFGTKLLETELRHLFPGTKIARFDADNGRGQTLDARYAEVRDGEVDIIIGTQTVAKGLDLPKLATVGVAQADAGLSLPDFAAEERTFHLLTQVLGRVGRGHLDAAEAIVQTYQPEHPVIQCALKADYDGFYKYQIAKRRAAGLPPFRYIAKLSITYKTEKTTLARVRDAERILRAQPDLEVSVPMPAFHERTRQGYTWQLVIKARSRAKLTGALKFLPKNTNTHLALDPPSLL